jgi:hypothetical protein
MKKAVFWDVAPCRSGVSRRFGGTSVRFTQYLHDATSQKTAFFIVTAVKTSNLTSEVMITSAWHLAYMFRPWNVGKFLHPPLKFPYVLEYSVYVCVLHSFTEVECTECNWKVRTNFGQEFHIPKQYKISVTTRVQKYLICELYSWKSAVHACWCSDTFESRYARCSQ